MPSAFAAMRQGGAPHRSGAKQPVPTIVFHGDRDTTDNPVNSDQVIAQSKAGSDLRTTVSRGQAPGGISYTRHNQMCCLERVERPKATKSIRCTCDSYGQGVHGGNLYRMSRFPGVELVASNSPANILPLQECQPPGWGDSYGSISCSE